MIGWHARQCIDCINKIGHEAHKMHYIVHYIYIVRDLSKSILRDESSPGDRMMELDVSPGATSRGNNAGLQADAPLVSFVETRHSGGRVSRPRFTGAPPCAGGVVLSIMCCQSSVGPTSTRVSGKASQRHAGRRGHGYRKEPFATAKPFKAGHCISVDVSCQGTMSVQFPAPLSGSSGRRRVCRAFVGRSLQGSGRTPSC